ncbi:MAG TPA: hypothetical protein VD816_05335 [Ohtaekwangia sp.]|nr:hypothetical protein [Ohtaekwangia sp.]
METLEARLQRRIHVSLYALLFLTVLLGISVVLEGCSGESISPGKKIFSDYNTVGFHAVVDQDGGPAEDCEHSYVALVRFKSEGVAF